MSELKSTPGPWAARRRSSDGQWTIRADLDAGEVQLADVWPADDANGRVVHLPDKANAHLIAAAPSLYEALADARFRCWGNEPCNDPLAHRIDAVLSKARGESV